MSIERTKEQIAVMQAYCEGKPIEMQHISGQWLRTHDPRFTWGSVDYRVAVTKPVVPWDVLADWVQFVAMNADGLLKGYEEKPTLNSSYWDYTGGQAPVPLNRVVKYTLGTCDWQDSLVERPKGGEA